jgi:glycosyltransferase involved in cell wall biosynthesis
MDGRPRVLLLVTLAETGGAQTYVAELLPALAHDHDVVVAAHGDGFLADAARAAGVRYVALEHVRRPLHPWRDLRGLLELVRLMRRVRPDLVHANSSKAGVLGRLAAALARVPVRVFTVHGWAFRAHDGAAATAYLWADRLMRPLTTRTICVAESELRSGVAAGTCSPARTVVIRNGVDLTRPRARHDGDGSGGTAVALAVGRLRAPKDFACLVRATAELAPGRLRVFIVGDGPDRPALQAEIARLGAGASVELLGERADVAELLAAADLFVLPSHSEGMPMSVLEAMAAGLPVVASAVGGIPELVRDGETGRLVAPGDAPALARALDALAGDPVARARLGAAGRRRAEREFDVEACRRAHLELYRAALAGRATRARR